MPQWLLSALRHPHVLVWLECCAILLGAVSVLMLVVEWRRHRWFQAYGQAFKLMRKGESQRAVELLQKLARSSFGSRRTAALAGVGLCRIHRGEYAEAVALLEPLTERRLPRSMWMDEVALRGHLALCLAMLGETRRAWHWLGEAHRRFGGRVTFLVLPEVAILCREGHLGAALKFMDHCWPLLLADGLVCSRLRMFRAYALKAVDPERDAGFIIITQMSITPFLENELAFCREHWPVLADFIQAGEELVARGKERTARGKTRARASGEAEWEAPKDTPTPEDGTSG